MLKLILRTQAGERSQRFRDNKTFENEYVLNLSMYF